MMLYSARRKVGGAPRSRQSPKNGTVLRIYGITSNKALIEVDRVRHLRSDAWEPWRP